MAVSNRVATVTQNFLAPFVAETVLGSNVGLTRFVGAAKKGWGGAQEEVPVKYTKNNQISSFEGMDTLSTAQVDTRVKMTYDPKFVQAPVVLSKTELAKNNTERRVLDLAKVEMTSTAYDLADSLGDMFYSDGSGNAGKDILGLAGIVDDGTSTTTIGGLTRTTYPTLNGTVTASSGTVSFAKLATLYNACMSGVNKPTVGLTTETVYSLVESLFVPQERVNKDVSMVKGLQTGGGYTALMWRGVPILADEKCTSGSFFFLNEDSMDWKAIDYDGEPISISMNLMNGEAYDSVKGLGFRWTGWTKPINQEAIVGRIILAGNMVPNNPRFNGRLTGITSAA